jgi:HSP90 family molecular chaperone
LDVSDNGIGLSERVVRHYLTKIGRTYYDSDEVRELAPGLQPISRFGIGILSAFMISDHVELLTRHGNEDALGIEITDASSYLKVRSISKEPHGTEVRLRLRSSFTLDIAPLVKTYAQCLNVQVEIIESGEKVHIDSNPQLEFDWKTWLETPMGLDCIDRRARRLRLRNTRHHAVSNKLTD